MVVGLRSKGLAWGRGGGADEGSFTPPPRSQPPTVNIHTFIFAHRDSNPRPPAVRHESQVCYPTVPLGHPVTKFDVSLPEKLLKIVATIGEIFSLKFTKYRLAAGLRPDPLGERLAKALPQTP